MPESSRPARPRVAVIGAGITGLTAADRLRELLPELELAVFESSDRPGGVLQTDQHDGFLVERSADNFLTREPWATDLCRRIGLGEDLLPTEVSRRKALVVRDGRVLPAPEGFVLMAPRKLGPILKTPLLSWRGKLRLCCEPFVRRRRLPAAGLGDESVADFARRRLGTEVFERLVQPLLAGIYTADPEKLSMAATMPQFLEQERRYGSLWRAARQSQDGTTSGSGARYGLFVAPRFGMQQLTGALVQRLPDGVFHTHTAVESVARDPAGWLITGKGGALLGRFDAVVLTPPAHQAAKMLSTAKPELAAELSAIEYAGCSVVCLGYGRDQIGAELAGFGFVVPAVEKRRVIAVSFSSLKFPGRAPDGAILVRAFVGGALQPELAERDDAELQALVTQELNALIAARGEPLFCRVARWPRGMPQYHLGHLERVERIETLVAGLPGVEIAGAAYRGVGIPQCIRGGEQAAERVAAFLQPASRT